MQIRRGIIESAQKVVIYGPEGIGKSYFASKFPNPIFIDTEGSTKHMDVARTEPDPSSWIMLMDQVQYFKNHPKECETLVIDTADWAERLCKTHVCDTAKKDGIEEFGYGKGYTYLAEAFGKLLNLLTELVDLGINAVLVAHAVMRKFEQPDEMGAYDRWEMKLEKKVFSLVKEWADLVLFANYKTYVVNVDKQGTEKGKNKAQGGRRVMYTTHHPCWDAKNRQDLKDELELDFDEIKHCIPTRGAATAPLAQPVTPPPVATQSTPSTQAPEPPKQESLPWTDLGTPIDPDIPKALRDLMAENNVSEEELKEVIAQKGYYPKQTPIGKYDSKFIQGVLIAAWPQVFAAIQVNRNDPF